MLAHALPLPLLKRVIFVDWHGVLSRRLFWSSLGRDIRKELELSRVVDQIFARDVVQPWMRGHTSTHELLSRYVDSEISLWLEQVVVAESSRARLNRNLINQLRLAKNDCYVVLASDNMDCFAKAMRNRSGQITVFDDFLISSNLGALKNEPHKFFGPWLNAMGLDFSNAILIDDDPGNVAAFCAVGGQGVLYAEDIR